MESREVGGLEGSRESLDVRLEGSRESLDVRSERSRESLDVRSEGSREILDVRSRCTACATSHRDKKSFPMRALMCV